MPDFASIKYDQASDVLYIATKPGRKARMEETLPGVLWRYDCTDGNIVGVTILDYSHYWKPRLSVLSEDIVDRLHISRGEVRRMLERVEAPQ